MATKEFDNLVSIHSNPAMEKEVQEQFLDQLIQLMVKCDSKIPDTDRFIARKAYQALTEKCISGAPIKEEESIKILERMHLYPWGNEEMPAKIASILCTIVIGNEEYVESTDGKSLSQTLDHVMSDIYSSSIYAKDLIADAVARVWNDTFGNIDEL
jgi:hypothetical protein